MKIKFKNRGWIGEGEFFEKEFKFGNGKLYILVYFSELITESYYAITINCPILNVQINDYNIQTKKQAVDRIKRELLSAAKKNMTQIESIVLV